MKRIEISQDEAEICQYGEKEMYNMILQYQNNGIRGVQSDDASNTRKWRIGKKRFTKRL